MKHLLIIVCVAFSGCTKLMPSLMGGQSVPGLTTSTPAPNTTPQKLVIMGQSNADNFSFDGVEAMKTLIPLSQSIDCAKGGSWIDQWAPGQPFYQDCVALIGTQAPDLIFWYQGEADSASPDLPGNPTAEWATWAQRFTAIANDLKQRYPHAKIIMAQLAQFDPVTHPNLVCHWQDVKNQQSSVFIPGVEMVRTDDLAMPPDGVHLSAASQYQLGLRVAHMFQNWGK